MARVNESGSDILEVVFKKDRDDGEVIAFFPQSVSDGSANDGMISCYAHMGQHQEASLDYFKACKPCSEDEYDGLLNELESIYDDTKIVVKQNMRYRKPRRK